MVEGNEQVQVGKTYTINITEGMLLVAYPNEDQQTEFEFVYQVVPKILQPEPVVVPVPTPSKFGPMDVIENQQIAIIGLFVVLILFSLCIFCICKKKTNTLNKVE